MWPTIKRKFPKATLDICYGWGLFEGRFQNNPERMAWKEKMDEQMQGKGITHHGRVGKSKLAEIRGRCGIWAYPTYFPEINCITALDAQADGLVPVVTDYAALKETVGSGVKVQGDIYMEETQIAFLQELLRIMKDKEVWEAESKKAKEFAKNYKWENIAEAWTRYF